MLSDKNLDAEFQDKVAATLRLAFIKYPPCGPRGNDNAQQIWYVVGDLVYKTHQDYRKKTKWQYNQQTRGFFNGAAVSNWENHYKRYEQKVLQYGREEFRKSLDSYLCDDASANDLYWTLGPKVAEVSIALRPEPPDSEFTPKMAEYFATQVMLHLGATGAKTTSFTKDGGADCVSDEFVVQVKHLAGKVGVATVREIVAVGHFASRQAVIFSRNGYTQGALEVAILNDVILFTYSPAFIPETDVSKYATLFGLSFPVESKEAIRRVEIKRRKSAK